MKERGERERAGEEWEEGGLLASRFSWWVPGGGGGVRGVSSSTQKDSGKYDGVLEHSSTPPLIFLPSCSS